MGFFPLVLVLLPSAIYACICPLTICEVKTPSVQFLTVQYSLVPHYREYSLFLRPNGTSLRNAESQNFGIVAFKRNHYFWFE